MNIAGDAVWSKGAIAAATLGALGLAWLLRAHVVEDQGLAAQCATAGTGAGICALRDALIVAFTDQRLGWAALALACVAFVGGSRRIATAAVLLACAGLVLYSATPSAPAFWLAMLLLAGSADGGAR